MHRQRPFAPATPLLAVFGCNPDTFGISAGPVADSLIHATSGTSADTPNEASSSSGSQCDPPTSIWKPKALGVGTLGSALTVDACGALLVGGSTCIDCTSGTSPFGFVAKFAPDAAQPAWRTVMGPTEADGGHLSVTDLAVGPSGRIYAAGTLGGTVQIDPDTAWTSVGDLDAFVAAFEPDGSLAWFVPSATAEVEATYAIAVDADEILVAAGVCDHSGSAPFDVFLMRVKDGAAVWQTCMHAPETQFVSGMDLGDDGTAYITGYSKHPDGDPLKYDAWLAALPARERPVDLLWSRWLGGVDTPEGTNDFAVDIDVDGDSLFVSGACLGQLFEDGVPADPPVDCQKRSALVAHYDLSGARRWIRAFGQPEFPNYPFTGNTIAARGDDLLVGGVYHGNLVADAFQLLGGGDQGFLLRLDRKTGEVVAARRLESPLASAVADLAAAPADVYLTGVFDGAVGLGDQTLNSRTGADNPAGFLLRLP